ncbi:MAG: hypothetical protein V2A73_20140, partial [Pseudomonadota bacterium]
MGLWDLAFKALLRLRPHDLLDLVPGVDPEEPLRLLDKEIAPPPPLPRALDGCAELSVEGSENSGPLYHVEFESQPSSDSGEGTFLHYALAMLAYPKREVRPVVYYLMPGKDGRRPKSRYRRWSRGKLVLDFRFEAVCLWKLTAEEILARPAPGLWAAVALTDGATLAHVGRAW